MRVIKFRAWEKKRFKTMCFGGIGDNIFFGFKYPDGKQRVWLQDEWGDPDFEVMQFTGLMDKNGKEIYEGDATFDPNAGKWYYVAFGFTSWDDATFHLIECGNPELKYRLRGAENIEFSLNIYESPNLLK